MSHDEFIVFVKDVIYEEFVNPKIVPSIIIAHAAIDSQWGSAEIAIQANNLFCIRPSNYYYGDTYKCKCYTGDGLISQGTFIKYDSWEESIIDHMKMILATDDYDQLAIMSDLDEMIKYYCKVTFTESDRMIRKITNIIKRHNLHEHDCIRGKHNPFALAQVGDSSEAVKWLQYELAIRGYSVIGAFVTNFFDYQTMYELKRYQRDHGLEPSGILDLKTVKMFSSEAGDIKTGGTDHVS